MCCRLSLLAKLRPGWGSQVLAQQRDDGSRLSPLCLLRWSAACGLCMGQSHLGAIPDMVGVLSLNPGTQAGIAAGPAWTGPGWQHQCPSLTAHVSRAQGVVPIPPLCRVAVGLASGLAPVPPDWRHQRRSLTAFQPCTGCMPTPTPAVQLVGLQYYQEIEQPIPRGQAEEVLAQVQETLGVVLPRLGCRDAAEADVLLAGSYRRGKPRTGEPTRVCGACHHAVVSTKGCTTTS